MKEERKSNELTMDSVLEKVQSKTREVFGPLSRAWMELQQLTEEGDENGDPVRVDLYLLLSHTKKFVLVLSQALNTMTYHRRFNALSVIMTQPEAKTILKEKADVLGISDF